MKQIIADLQIGVNNKKMERLGNINGGKIRPIKLTFNNTDDQQKVFNHLKNLKVKASYSGNSNKENYTYNKDYCNFLKRLRNKI